MELFQEVLFSEAVIRAIREVEIIDLSELIQSHVVIAEGVRAACFLIYTS